MSTPSDARPTARGFTERLGRRERALGYWVVLDAPVATERLARLGYDYVCIDGQHGLLEYSGILRALMAVDAGGSSVGLVRVGANDPFLIGQALDAGAAGVIVPLVNSAADAARAVSAALYPPLGTRSYGPMRSGLRVGPKPGESNASVSCLAMIETSEGLANVEEICAVPGLTGVYVGPSDLSIAVGGAFPADPAVADVFQEALVRIRDAAAAAGVAAGIHTSSGAEAARLLSEGFTFATVSSDLGDLERGAADQLRVARTQQ